MLESRNVTVPRRLGPEDADLSAVLALLQREFAYMDGRVDPPSSVHLMSLESLRQSAAEAEVWVIGAPVRACVILTPRPAVLYLGKLAVAAADRGHGYARRLIDLAVERARALGLDEVELGTRIELTENQQAFLRMGFREVLREAHPGFDRPTAITYRRAVPA